ncbi:MAG: polysaccharide deacetylase family protein [Patescibacteria group bacterium]|jgi:peptidoglycan/xylan/chitin deacetylase (PgdA/CDA1 family)
MTQIKKLFKRNQTALLLSGVVILALLIFIPAKLKDSAPVVKTQAVLSTLTLTTIPDQRTDVEIPILMYHHIRDYNNPSDQIGSNLSVSLSNFQQQLDFLKSNGYMTITFSDLNLFPQKALPDKPIILTFDDGYADNYQAFTSLKKNGQLGVFYIISGYLGRAEHLTASQIKEISDSGMEIGSHSQSHPDLTGLDSTKLALELTSSKSTLEEITGKPISSLCYPAGKYNQLVATAVGNSNYLSAVTTKSGIASTRSPKYELSRVRINPNDSLKIFAAKISQND